MNKCSYTLIAPLIKIAAVGSIFLISTQCSSGDKKAEKDKVTAEERVVAVKTINVEAKSFIDYGEFLADLEGSEQAVLISHQGGRVSGLEGQVGRAFKKGDKLCNIEGDEATVALQSAQLAVSTTFSTWKRKKEALAKNAAAKLNVDQAQGEYLRARGMQIQAEKAFRGAYCISPITGIVVERLIQQWDFLTPGSPTFVIARLQQMKAMFGIPESEISGYQVGRPVQLTIANLPGQVFEGTLTSLAQSVNHQNRTFAAEALIKNPNKELLPGLTGRLQVERFHFDDQIVIPSESVLTEGKTSYVYTVENNLAKKKLVTILTANKENSVIATGLNKGDELIVAGHLLAGDGVKIKKVTEEAL